ncbi:MAG: DUF4011 domain-containing protein, partial [Phycisphaerae bacterium]
MSDTQPTFDLPGQLDRFRRKLLDLTGTNRLLAYRKSRRRSLQIVDELPNQIFKRLVEDQRRFSFAPYEAPADSLPEAGANPDVELPAETADELKTAARHYDELLGTTEDAQSLEVILKTMRQDAHAAVQETGVNHLYLALGMLEWYEEAASDVPRLAPLLLVPVHIERDFSAKAGRYVYWIAHTEEEIQWNQSLHRKLKQDFGLELPAFGEEMEGEETPEAYFKRVADAVSPKATWRVRREAVLGFFSFAKLLMYLDLDPANWPEHHGLLANDVVKGLFAGEQIVAGNPLFAADYDIDDVEPDNQLPLIAEADSSQHSALIDIAAGKSMVIEGPPGTGKSQTITNAIAGAMAQGKRVLFVSEKLTALEVVKQKLAEYGLDALCLELHSKAARGREVFDQLQRRLQATFPRPRDIDQERSRLRAEHERLAAYLKAAGRRIGPRALPTYEVFWHIAELRGRGITALAGVQPPLDISPGDLDQRLIFFDTFARFVTETGPPAEHPWRFFDAVGVRESNAEAFAGPTGQLAESLSKLADLSARFQASTDLTWKLDPRWLRTLPPDTVQRLVPPADHYPQTCDALLTGPGRRLAEQLLTRLAEHERLTAAVTPRLRVPADVALASAQQASQSLTRYVPAPAGVPVAQFGELRLLAGNAEAAAGRLLAIAGKLKQLGVDAGPPPHAARLADFDAAAERYALFRHPAVGDGTLLRPEHFYSSIEPTFDTAAKERLALSLQHDQLAKTFELPLVPAAADVRRLKAEINRNATNWLRFFSSSYKQARREVAAFLKPGVKLRPADLAVQLNKLERFLEARGRFDAEEGYRQSFGPVFTGFSTDWPRLEGLLKWAKTARSRGIGYEAAEPVLAVIREDAQAPTPEAVAHARKAFELETAAGPLQTVSGTVQVQQQPLERVRQGFAELSAAFGQLAEASGQFDLPPNAAAADLLALTQDVLKLDALRKQIEGTRPYADLLGEAFRGTATDPAPLRASMDWLDGLTPLSLPAALLKWLVVGDLAAKAAATRSTLEAALPAAGGYEQARSGLAAGGEVHEATLLDAPDPGGWAGTLTDALHRLPPWANLCRHAAGGRLLGLAPFLDALAVGTLNAADARD